MWQATLEPWTGTCLPWGTVACSFQRGTDQLADEHWLCQEIAKRTVVQPY